MGIIFDILLIIILVLCIINGYKKGFVKTVLKLSAGLIAFISALIFSNALSAAFYDGFMYSSVREPVYETISSEVDERGTSALESVESTVEKFDALLSKFGHSSDDIIADLEKSSSSDIDKLCNELADDISSVIASALSHALAFISFFVVTLILVLIVSHFSGIIRKIPIVGGADGILGALLGACSGIIISLIVAFAVRALLMLLSSKNPDVSAQLLDGSFIIGILEKIKLFKLIF